MDHTNGTVEAGPSSAAGSPRASVDSTRQAATATASVAGSDAVPGSLEAVQAELERTRSEKEHLNTQYRTLLGKLTAMRNTLGEKLKEDAEELDRREGVIADLTSSKEGLEAELATSQASSKALTAELETLRSRSDDSSSDVLSLTREMREMRGEMERLRAERDEFENDAGAERDRREVMEEEVRAIERRERDARARCDEAEEKAAEERERAGNLQEVLSEFQEAKDSELRQATAELERQLKLAAGQLSEFKLRAANAESSLSSLESNATKVNALEKELRDKNGIIAKLRHDAVVTNEHLTEALRRLRKNTSDNNVDRRLVTNILLSFLTTARADSKRFEMLSLLSTILAWDDSERERAGLQRVAKRAAPRRQSAVTPEDEAAQAAMNESFSNLFVEFLLKEASQGASSPTTATSAGAGPFSPRADPMSPSSGRGSPYGSQAGTPRGAFRTMSSSSLASIGESSGGSGKGPSGGIGVGRKASFGLQEALGRQ